MKNILYLLFFFSVSANASDTITVWHVFYNKNKIREYNQYNTESKIILKLNSIKQTDSITVKYFSEIPYQDSKITFSIDFNDSIVIDSKGNNNTFTFPVSALTNWMEKKKSFKFKIFRNNWKYRPADKELLFEIEIK